MYLGGMVTTSPSIRDTNQLVWYLSHLTNRSVMTPVIYSMKAVTSSIILVRDSIEETTARKLPLLLQMILGIFPFEVYPLLMGK